MKRIFVVFTVAMLLLSGCTTASTAPTAPAMTNAFQYQAASAGRIGCPAGEITITNIERPGGIIMNSRSWTATCKRDGRSHYCSGLFTFKKGLYDVACSPAATGHENKKATKKLRPPHK